MDAPGFSPHWPMGYLETFGPRADPVTALAWGLIVLSCAVCAIVAVLVLAGVLARRSRAGEPASIRRGQGALAWVWGGVAVSAVALLACLVWTVQVLAAIDSPPTRPALTIEVTGHQWWWEARYLSDRPDQVFTTANEIHVPVGRPVLIKLASADVIHSFWVPALTGKTDTIPGRTNVSWLQADRPGVYRGQCTEYCGEDHALMAFYVVAQPPAAFEAWRRGQLATPAAPAAPQAVRGAALFQDHCSVCHRVAGTDADGVVGPDLTHLMSRSTIASGILPNTGADLAGWVSDPQALKPATRMPPTNLSGPDLHAVVAYLETLK